MPLLLLSTRRRRNPTLLRSVRRLEPVPKRVHLCDRSDLFRHAVRLLLSEVTQRRSNSHIYVFIWFVRRNHDVTRLRDAHHDATLITTRRPSRRDAHHDATLITTRRSSRRDAHHDATPITTRRSSRRDAI